MLTGPGAEVERPVAQRHRLGGRGSGGRGREEGHDEYSPWRQSDPPPGHAQIRGIVEMIRRSLAHDFWYFSLTAVVLFGVTMAVMFRSVRVFLGMLATCTSAVLLTLLLQQMFGKRIGILTVNLGTIVFVVALFRQGFARLEARDKFRRGVAAGALAGCGAALVHSFFDFPLHITSIALLFLLLAALATTDRRVEDESQTRRRHRRRSRRGPETSGALPTGTVQS